MANLSKEQLNQWAELQLSAKELPDLLKVAPKLAAEILRLRKENSMLRRELHAAAQDMGSDPYKDNERKRIMKILEGPTP